MAEIKFVDWDGLVYYDTRSKQYIQNKFDLALKYGGSFDKLADVPSPGVDTINVVYKITAAFSTNSIDFVEEVQNLTYAANTLIQVVETPDSQYKFDILVDSAPILTPEGDVVYTKAEIDEILKNYVTEEELESKGYLTEHQDISGLATKEELATVQNQSASNEVKILALDGEVLGLKSQVENLNIPTKVSELENDKGYLTEVPSEYITEEELNAALADIEHPTVDLTGYATEEWVKEQKYLTEHQDLSEYSKKADLDVAVSDLSGKISINENSINYINGILTDINSEVNELDNDVENINNTLADVRVDLAGKASKEDIPSAVSELINDRNFATETFVTTKIAEAQLSGGDIDLSGYATKDDIKDFVTLSEVEDQGYLKEIPSEYVTESELEAKGYLTEHQDISGKLDVTTYEADKATFATKTYVDEQLQDIDVDLTDYYTKTQTDAAIATAVSAIEIPEVPTKVSQLENDKGYLTEHQSLAGYATEEYVNDAIAGVEVDLTGYATETWVNEQGFAKTSDIPEVPTKVSELENDAGYITAQDIPETDLTNYYTKTETDTAITNAVDAINIPDVSNFVTAADVEAMGYIKEVPAEYVTETELDAKGYLTEHQDLSNYALKSEIPSIEGLATETYVDEKIAEIPSTDLTGYATETYVDNAIANIDIPTVPTKVSQLENDSAYATETFVQESIEAIDIPQAEIYKVDFNAPDYTSAMDAYNAGKVLVLINATPDTTSYALMNYANERYITFTKFLMSRSEAYGAFNTYYLAPDNTWEVSKEVILNKVEANTGEEATEALTTLRVGKQVLSIPVLDGYATQEFVLQKIAEAEIAGGDVDLSAYYTKTETDAAIKTAVDAIDIPDVSGLATKEEVAEVEAKIPSLDGYATEEWVNEQGFLTSIPSEYVTEDELNAKGYLTEHQSLEGYATEEWVADQSFAKISDIPEAELYKVDYNNPDYASAMEAYNAGKVLVLINAAPDATSYAVMNYANERFITFTKFLMSRSEAYGAFNTYYLDPTNTWTVSDEVVLNKVEGNVTDETVGELKTIRIGKNVYSLPDLDGYATEDFVTQKIAEAQIGEGELTNYYTKAETDAAITEAVDQISVPTKTSELTNDSGYITEADIPSLEGYATEDWVTTQDFAKVSDIPEAELYTVNYANPDYAAAKAAYEAGKVLILIGAAPDIDSYAIMNYVSDSYITFTKFLISRSRTYGVFNAYYLKTDNTWELANDVRINGVEANVEDESIGDLTKIRIGKEVYSIPVPDLSAYALKSEIPVVPTNVSAFNNDAGYLTEIPSDYITDSELDSKGFASQNDLDNLSDNFDTLSTTVVGQTTDIEELQTNVSDNASAITTIEADIDALENDVAHLKAIDHSQYIDQNTLTNALASKANDIPFTEDYRVGNAVGEFVANDSVQGMTIVQILTKLLALTLYTPPAGDIPAGTPESAVEIITEEIPAYELGQDGQPVEVAYTYTTMTPEEAKADNQTDSYFYQIIDPDTGEAIETGYQIATQYQEINGLTVLLPDIITNFHVEEYSTLAGDWAQPNWSLVENTDYSIAGYKCYTVNAEILSGIAIRIIIED